MLPARIVQYSEDTGVGTAAFALLIGGNYKHTADARYLLHGEETVTVGVALIDADSPLILSQSGDPEQAYGSSAFAIYTAYPDRWLGVTSGFLLEPGATGVDCFLVDRRPSAPGTAYTIASVPAGAALLSATSVVIDANGFGNFSLDTLEPGSFHLQATGGDGAVLRTRSYTVRNSAILENYPLNLQAPGASEPGSGGGEPNGLHCVAGGLVSYNLDGIYEECSTPCVRADQSSPPSRTCILNETDARPIYFPGICIAGKPSEYCQLEDNSPFASLPWRLLGYDNHRKCFSSGSPISGGAAYSVKKGPASITISYTPTSSDADWLTACCTYVCDRTAPIQEFDGINCTDHNND